MGTKTPRIYTTAMPVGYDVSISFVDQAMSTNGCNFLALETTEKFFATLQEQFEYLVTPVVRRLRVEMQGGPFKVLKTIGWENSRRVKMDTDHGEVLQIDSLFPSPLDSS